MAHLIYPTGQFPKILSSPFEKKYFALPETKIKRMVAAIPRFMRALRDRHEAWCGIRWTRAASSDE